jgi:hypothetical protein
VSALLSLAQAAPLLGCRDARTARKRIRALGVPVLELGGRLYIDESDVLRARRAHARPLTPAAEAAPSGVQLPPGARLWDGRPDTTVGRRGGSRPARGGRGVSPAARAAYPGLADRSSRPTAETKEER